MRYFPVAAIALAVLIVVVGCKVEVAPPGYIGPPPSPGPNPGPRLTSDAYESDNTYSLTRPTFALGQRQSHTIFPAGDRDYLCTGRLPTGTRQLTFYTDRSTPLQVRAWRAGTRAIWKNDSSYTVRVQLFKSTDRVMLVPRKTYTLSRGRYMYAPAGRYSLKLAARKPKRNVFGKITYQYVTGSKIQNRSGGLTIVNAGSSVGYRARSTTQEAVSSRTVQGRYTIPVAVTSEYPQLLVRVTAARSGDTGRYTVELR